MWIADLEHERVEVYREPVNGRYQQMTVYERGSAVAPAAFPDALIAVDEIFG